MAKRQTQYQFKPFKDFTRTRHGGGERKGMRKLARPVATKTPMHLTLRAERAKGARSMLRQTYFSRIQAIVFGFGERNDVQILRFANVGNHLHLLVKARTRKGFQSFLRTITGLIARLVMGAVKGLAQGRFWDELAFSRIVAPGRDLKNADRYIIQNALEAFGAPTKRHPGDPTIKLYGVYGFQ